jgi:hypothetical protein
MATNTGLRNQQKINEIQLSGSLAIKTKNDFGVHIFSGSVADDGIITGKLQKPKYDISEIRKSVDTTIVELIPIRPPIGPDTVLRSIWNEATKSIEDLTKENQRLNTIILDLEAKVGELEIASQSLRVDLDAKDLLLAAAENQVYQANSKVESSITELQNAIQKATAESIQRVSLFARNQSLEDQVKQLNETIKGLEAKKAEGAKQLGDITYRVLKITNPAFAQLRVEADYKNNITGWINGPEIELYNSTNTATTVTFDLLEGASSRNDELLAPLNITIPAKETKIYSVNFNKAKLSSLQPNQFNQGSVDHNRTFVINSAGTKTNLTFTLFKDN